MSETEKAILGTVLLDTEYAPILFDNITDPDMFLNPHNREIFKTMKELWDGKSDPCYAVVYDVLEHEIPKHHFYSFFQTQTALPEYYKKKFLYERIRELKWQRLRSNLIKEINSEIKNPIGSVESILDIVKKYDVSMSEREKNDFESSCEEYLNWIGRERTGIKTGIPLIDKETDEFSYGELIVIMGRTTTGKTWVALNILEHLVSNGVENIGFFSLEMTKGAINERLRQLFFGINRWKLKEKIEDGSLDDREFKKFYSGTKIYSSPHSMHDIDIAIERDALKVVFVDFLGLVKSSSAEGSLYQKTTERIIEAKNMAKKHEAVIFMLVQISRAGGSGYEEVSLSMARDSVVGDSYVLLSDGRHEKIKNLVGKKPNVVTINKKYKFSNCKAIRVWKKGKKETFKISTELNYQITVTKSHPFLTDNRGWVRLKDLSIGDRIATINFEEHENPMDSSLAFLKIRKIEKNGIQDVYDMEIPENNNFIANNICVHNSGQIEEVADFIIGVWNSAEDKENRNQISVDLLKNKRGRLQKNDLFFDYKTGKIAEFEGRRDDIY